MTDLPEPLTPSECDLRTYEWMPLDVNRLLTSETWILGTADEKVAAVTLWCESWRQVPSASLPDDDRMLAHLSRAGSAWKRVREAVMRSWVKCSDGRLYHPVVAEKARFAWEEKQKQRERTEAARLAKKAKKDAHIVCDEPPQPPATLSVTENDTELVTESVTEIVTASNRTEQNRTEQERKKDDCTADADAAKPGRRGTRLPDGWEPRAEDRQFALSMGLNIKDLLDNFRDYWISVPGAKGVKLDWDATFRNRCRDQQGRGIQPKLAALTPREQSFDANARRIHDLQLKLSGKPPEEFFTGPTLDGRNFDA